jgi:AcrR family transcriptional regulator
VPLWVQTCPFCQPQPYPEANLQRSHVNTAKRRGAPRRDEPTARERLIAAVGELFYRDGVHAVGVDTVSERSGVSKSSLYRTFASKDDLIAAFAEDQNRRYWEWWDQTIEAHQGHPRKQIEALLAGVAHQIGQPNFRGCPFINLAAELADPKHPALAITCGNKQEVRARLRRLSRELGAREPERLGDQLSLLMDGAYGRTLTLGAKGLQRELLEMAKLLMDVQTAR